MGAHALVLLVVGDLRGAGGRHEPGRGWELRRVPLQGQPLGEEGVRGEDLVFAEGVALLARCSQSPQVQWSAVTR